MNSYKDRINAEHERDIDWKEHQDQMQQDAGLEPATSPYYIPDNDILCESLGPDAWYADINGSKKMSSKNDNYALVMGKIREYMAEGDALAVGEIMIEYSMAYLDSCATDRGLEFDVHYLGGE